MAINVKEIIDRARRVIQDETSVRWPLPELLLWFNDGIRELALYKPTAFSVSTPFVLTAGTYQKAPADSQSVLRVTRNLKTVDAETRQGGLAIRAVDRDMLDSQNPNWHDTAVTAATRIVRNVAYDMSEPNAFWVFPPNDGTGIVELVVSKPPAPIATPNTPDDLDQYNIDADAQSVFSGAILDYVLYRAYSKDSTFSGSAQRAAAYYAAFGNAIGVNIMNAKAFNLNTKPTTQEENRA